MPKSKINDYIFYKIVCLDDSCELCYVGSTVNWKERRRRHTFNCTNENSKNYNTKVYQIIRENSGWQNFKMIELGTREQLTLRQAEQIEEEYRVELKANLNERRCFVTPEQKLEHKKKYKEDNKDKIKARESEKIACECGCQIRRDGLLEHKRSQKHIRLMELLQNKDTSNKVVCECGCMLYRIDDLARHKRSQKHIRLMELVQNN